MSALHTIMRAWVYIMANKPRGIPYVGVTSDLVRRVWEHREGEVEGFTKEHSCKMLVWFEEHDTMLNAIQREKNIKHWSRKWKIELIEGMNPKWDDLWWEITK